MNGDRHEHNERLADTIAQKVGDVFREHIERLIDALERRPIESDELARERSVSEVIDDLDDRFAAEVKQETGSITQGLILEEIQEDVATIRFLLEQQGD